MERKKNETDARERARSAWEDWTEEDVRTELGVVRTELGFARRTTAHFLKTWRIPFDAVAVGRKTYEIRKDDRNFKVGDILVLRRFDEESGEYTGEYIARLVTYKTAGGNWGLPSDLCVLALAFTPVPCHPSRFTEGSIEVVV